MIGFIAVISRL